MSILLELSYAAHDTLNLSEILEENGIIFEDVERLFIKWNTLTILLKNDTTVEYDCDLDATEIDYKYPDKTVITANGFNTYYDIKSDSALSRIKSELAGQSVNKKTDLLTMFNQLSTTERENLLKLYFGLLCDNPGLFYDLLKLNKNEDSAAICDAISNLIKNEEF